MPLYYVLIASISRLIEGGGGFMNTDNNDQDLKPVKNKNGAGRKSNYEYLVAPRLKEVEEWAKIGLTEAVIARKLGISVRSVNTYKKQYKQFLQAIKHGREDLLIDVKKSMAQLAVGFEYQETTETIVEDEKGVKITKVISTKRCLPNPIAQSRILSNLDPDYSDDPKSHKLKERKQEFNEKFAAANNALYSLSREEDN